MSDHDQDNPIRAMRARRAAEEAARREARRNELGPDPFGDDEVADIIEDTIDQQIWKLSRPGGDGTWMSVTHLLNRVLKLVEFKMGRTGSDEPVISLIISADEAHDMMNQIRDAIGPQDPDPLPWGRRLMPWRSQDPGKRQRDRERYQDPEFVRNRQLVLRRANGRCEQCGRRARLQVDHVVPLSVRIDHSLGNLQALCCGPGSCHAVKTAAEGHAARRAAAPRPAPRPSAWW